MFKVNSLLGLVSAISSIITFVKYDPEAKINENFKLSVNPFGNEESSFDTISWFENDDKYSLFLPSDVDRSSLKIYFSGAETIEIGNTTLHSGDTTNVFAESDSYSVKVGNNSYSVKIFQSENIPSMFLETKKPLDYINEDKNNKTSAKIRTFENGEMTLDSELKQIKGRGNSTWNHPKKPYNIKFDKKTSLLGMGKAKKWTLLANYLDPVSSKNSIGWELAKYFEQDFIPDYRYVDLYINNGYFGNYIVCDPVEIGETRIDIFDLAKATEKANDDADLETFPIESMEPFNKLARAQWVNIPNDPIDITGGYLLECDYHARTRGEVSHFVTSRQQHITIKEPEYASKKQVEYIGNFFQEAEDALVSPTGYNNHGKHYTDYFDIDSLVNFYILLELSANSDGGISSTFFYKDKGGKLCAGPLWDNDSAFGNLGIANRVTNTDPSQWIVNQNYYQYDDTPVNELPTIYTRLFRLRSFRDKVCERWSEIRNNLTATVIDETVTSIQEITNKSVLINSYRWYGATNEETANILFNLSKDFLTTRIKYFDIGFSKHAAYLFYDVNGGKGYCVENKIMRDGQFVLANGPYNSNMRKITNVDNIFGVYEEIITPIKPPKDDMVFVGWNTRKDGKGKKYRPGDPIFMYGTTTLYAQWKIATGDEKDYNEPGLLDNPIIEFLGSVLNALKLVLNN